MKWIIYIFLLFLFSCVQDPSAPKHDNDNKTFSDGAFILCEGIWGQSNSSLARYDQKTENIINEYYKFANPGLSLGDLANDIVLLGDTAFVAVTSTRVIEVFLVETGESLGRIKLPDNSAPREIAIMNDSIAFVSDLYLDVLHVFNPREIRLLDRTIPTGPAPEDVAIYQDLVFTANSGYGYYRKNEPKAGTVSVINAKTGIEIRTLIDLPNVLELLINEEKQLLYCCYYHITAEVDSVGGIIEYDLNTLEETRRWEIDALSINFSSTNDSLVFIADNNVYSLDISSDSQPQLLIINPKPSEIWYALAISPFDNTLWICNAKSHQINGELIQYDISSPQVVKRTYPLGVNPAKIVFF